MYYLIYEKIHTYRGGNKHPRTYSKEVYISGKNPEWDLESKTRTNKQGNKVHGVKVTYINTVSGSQASRGGTTYELPEREMKVTNIISVPKGAKNIRTRKEPPASHKSIV